MGTPPRSSANSAGLGHDGGGHRGAGRDRLRRLRLAPAGWPWSSATRPPGSTASVTGALDERVSIPMVGRAESLNVSVSAAVLCFEALRQRRLGDGAGRPSPVTRSPRPTMPGMDRSPTTPEAPMGGGGGAHQMTDAHGRRRRWSTRPGRPWPTADSTEDIRQVATSVTGKKSPLAAGVPGPRRSRPRCPQGSSGSDCTRPARPSRRSSSSGGPRSRADELAREMAESRIDLTEFIPGSHARAAGAGATSTW